MGYQIFQLPKQLSFDSSAQLLSGTKAYFYATGTTTPQTVYSDSTLTTPHTNPVISDAAGVLPTIYLDPSITYKLTLKTSGDVLIYTVDPVNDQFISRASIGQLLYPTSAGETAATITPVNEWYPYGCVDRYGTNAVPGTTDMSAAFNSAYAVAKQTGCSVRWGATAPYLLSNPVNCTGMRGIVSYDESSKNLSAAAPSIIIGHTGHGFDLSTSTEMTFNDMVAMNVSGTVPKTLFFAARNAAGSGAGIHRWNNVRLAFGGQFENEWYCYGSEENVWNDCGLYNHRSGSTIININASNTSSYTSSFVTIATGAQSNAGHIINNCNIFNFGNSGSHNEVCVQLEGAQNFTWDGGLWYCPNGAAYVRVVGTAPSDFFTVQNIRGETDGSPNNTYGIYVSTTGTTGVNAHAHWKISQVGVQSTTHAIRFDDAAEISNLTIDGVSTTSGLLLSVYNMSNSEISHSTLVVNGRAGGTVTGNTFVGNRANVFLAGTDSLNTGFDQTLGRYWETADSYTAASAACTGAITASAVWTLTKVNRKVTLILPAITATATAATSFTFGTVIPAAYRPASTLKFPVIVLDNGSTPNQLGMVLVNASTGAISVFKDVVATGVFSTTASAEGLPGVTEVSWTIA